MKYSVLAIFLLILLAGCKKSYICECEESFTYEGTTYTNDKTTKSEEKLTRKDAKDWCDEDEQTVDGYTTVCELK